MTARETARKIAVVLQEHPTDFGLTVSEIVTLGRTPHHVGFGGRTPVVREMDRSLRPP